MATPIPESLLCGLVNTHYIIKVIPACQEQRTPEIVVLNKGTWDKHFDELDGWSLEIKLKKPGEKIMFPLRAEAMWRRDIGGMHASVVDKNKVTLVFHIKANVCKADKPVLSVRDFDAGPFCRVFTSTSSSDLEREWLKQNPAKSGSTLTLGS